MEKQFRKRHPIFKGSEKGWFKKGHKVPQEWRKKIGLANKGRISYWKGKYLSKEVKKKIALGHKGKSSGMKGKHHSEETKRKLSLANKGKHLSEETKKKMSIFRKGKHHLYHSPSEFKKGYHFSKKIEEKRIKKVLQAVIKRPNKKEQQLNQILQRNFPNEWKYVGDGSLIIGGFCPDFICCDDRKIIIELNGDYWHSRPEVMERDKRKLKVYKSLGYSTIIIKEKELKDEDEVLRRLK